MILLQRSLYLTDNQVQETRELYIALDANGNLYSMAIEHAKVTAHLPDITYQQFEKASA